MLNALRTSFKETPYLKWILIATGIGLIAYLGNYFVGDQSGGGPAGWVARVNGEEISQRRLSNVARNLDEEYRRQLGDSYETIKPQLRIQQQALNAVVERELILQDARRMGLRGSSAALAERIRSDPSLTDVDGNFIGKERYKRVLDRYPGGHAAFERVLAQDLIVRQWTTLVTEPVMISDAELAEIFRERTESTAVDYVVVPAAEEEIDREIPEEELRRWYEEHLDEFTREAGWNLRYVLLDREEQMEKVEISDEDVRAFYEANPDTYRHLEQRRARHILLRLDPGSSEEDKQALRERAETALERLRAGEDFAELARELSDDTVTAQRGGDLDFFGRGQMVEAFEEAAFSTPVGEFAPITETPFGFHVIQVTDSRAAGRQPLEEVREEIRDLLRFRDVELQLAAEARRLREAVATADRLEQVAEQEELTVRSTFFSDGRDVPELGARPEFRQAVSELQIGALSQPLRVAAGTALVVVDEAVPAGPAPFEDVRDEVAEAIQADARREAALEAARRAHERAGDLEAAADALGREVQKSGDLALGQAPPGVGGWSPPLRESLFGDDAVEGESGVASVPAGAMVYRITRRAPFDAERFENEKEALRREVLRDRRLRYLQAFVERMKSQQEVEYNPLALRDEQG